MTNTNKKIQRRDKDHEVKPFEENLESLRHEELSGIPDEDD